jgi:uncharacterized protein YkwD
MNHKFITVSIILVVAAVLATAAYFSIKALKDASVTSQDVKSLPKQVFDEQEKATLYTEIAKYRSEKNLEPFTIDPRLETSAGRKSSDIQTRNYWSNISPDGDSPSDIILNEGYNHVYAGENLAKGQNSAPQLMKDWKNSQQSNENLTNPAIKNIGLGYSCNVEGVCVVVLHLVTEEQK